MQVRRLASRVGFETISALGCALAVIVGATAPTSGQERSQGADERREQVTDRPNARSVSFDGMQVAIDPATGRIRQPTPEEAQAIRTWLRSMLRRSSRGLTRQTSPSGAVTVDLQGRFMTLAVATKGKDGSLQLECLETEEAAAARLGVSKPVAAAPTTPSARQGGTR